MSLKSIVHRSVPSQNTSTPCCMPVCFKVDRVILAEYHANFISFTNATLMLIFHTGSNSELLA